MRRFKELTLNKKANLTPKRRERILQKVLASNKYTLREKGLFAMLVMLPYNYISCYDTIYENCNNESFTSIRVALRHLRKEVVDTRLLHIHKDKLGLMYFFPLGKNVYIRCAYKNGNGYNNNKWSYKEHSFIFSLPNMGVWYD